MPEQLYFPSTLQTDRHRSLLAFTAFETVDRFSTGRGVFKSEEPEKNTSALGTVFTYMPALGEIKYAQTYSDDGESVMEQLFHIVANTELSLDGIANAATQGAQVIGGAFGGEFRDNVSNDIKNPKTISQYKGPALRTQSIVLEFAPRDQAELISVGQILKFFKFHSATRIGTAKTYTAPDSGNRLQMAATQAVASARTGLSSVASSDRLKYPATWIIQEIPAEDAGQRWIPTFKFGPGYLHSVGVQATDHVSRFRNGDPVRITITLEFGESQMLTQDDIEAGF